MMAMFGIGRKVLPESLSSIAERDAIVVMSGSATLQSQVRLQVGLTIDTRAKTTIYPTEPTTVQPIEPQAGPSAETEGVRCLNHCTEPWNCTHRYRRFRQGGCYPSLPPEARYRTLHRVSLQVQQPGITTQSCLCRENGVDQAYKLDSITHRAERLALQTYRLSLFSSVRVLLSFVLLLDLHISRFHISVLVPVMNIPYIRPPWFLSLIPHTQTQILVLVPVINISYASSTVLTLRFDRIYILVISSYMTSAS